MVVELKTYNNMAKEWFTITKLSRDDLHKIGYDGMSVDDETMQKIADKIEEMFTSSMGMDVKVGGYQMDFRVDDEEDITGSDLQEIQDQFESAGIDETIEEAKDLEFTLIVGMEDVTDETFEDSMDIQVIKIDGKWYIDPTSM